MKAKMKFIGDKTIAIVLAFLLLFGTFMVFPMQNAYAAVLDVWTDGLTASAESTYSGGGGTSGNPYLLKTAGDLAQLTLNVQSIVGYSSGKYFKLENDIDLSGKLWVPIGATSGTSLSYTFRGDFDGNEHVVSNVVFDDSTFASKIRMAGFFGWTYSGATIYDLGVKDINITSTMSSNTYTGGFVGYADDGTTITNCYVTGAVSGAVTTGVGGFVGQTYNGSGTVFNNCYYVGTVSGGVSSIGGFAAWNRATIQNCYCAAALTTTASAQGGLIGDNDSTATNCYYDSTICATGGIGGSDSLGHAEGKSTEELKSETSVSLLNGASSPAPWILDTAGMVNSGYPILTWQQSPACSIGETEYDSLAEALSDVEDDDTITLLQDIEYISAISISGKDITFDVGNYDLDIVTTHSPALFVENGSVFLETTGGEFNVTCNYNDGYGLYVASGGSAEVSNVTTTDLGYGVYNSGGTVSVSGDVQAGYQGVYASGEGATLSVGGNVTGGYRGVHAQFYAVVSIGGDVTGNQYEGVYATSSAHVTVEGDVSGVEKGALAQSTGTAVTIGGDVSSSSTIGAYADFGASISIGGNASGVTHGIFSLEAEVSVAGNVTSSGNGVYVTRGEATIDGTITATNTYLTIDEVAVAADAGVPGTEPYEDYLIYTGTQSGVVRVKIPVVPVCAIGGTPYASLGAALSALTSGQTITLLEDITYNDRIWAASGSSYYPSLNLDLNGYDLEISDVEVPIASLEGYSVTVTDSSASGGGRLILNTTSDDSAPTGIAAGGSGSIVSVDDKVEAIITATGNGSKGIDANNGGVVEIGNGTIKAGTCGILATYGGIVTVCGDVIQTGSSASPEYGVYASNSSVVSIVGNVLSQQEDNCYGIWASNTSTVTIDGSIDAYYYLNLGGNVKNRDNYAASTTLANYYTYTDGDSSIWVSMPLEGVGSEENPYLISTEADLIMLSQISRNGKTFSDKYLKQTTDITLTQAFVPICWMSAYYGQNPAFNGHYDGQSYAISDLTNSSVTNWVGLFAVVGAEAVIENVVLEDVDITAGVYSGALAGENRGHITGCSVSGSVIGAGYLGGLVGFNYNGLLEDCHSSAAVAATSSDCAGGLVGYSVNGSGSAAPAVIGCSASGTVSGTSRTGGLVGELQGGLISESFSACTVSGTNHYTGGLVGAINSANGFVAAVENCYAIASVSGADNTYVGGLAGANWYGTIKNCYSAGTITGGGATNAGGLTGMIYTGAVTQDSFYDADVCALADTGKGTPKTTDEMKNLATFSTWSFPEVWTHSADNNGYPALAWQGFTHQTVSSDAALSALGASGITLTPVFSGETTSYSADVSSGMSSTTVTATPNDAAAAVTINGIVGTSKEVSLSAGSNTITVVVTAEDGETTKTYTLTITRSASSGGDGGGSSTPTGQQITVSTPDGGTVVTGTLIESGNTEQVTIGGTQFGTLADAGQGAMIPAPSATVTFDAKAINSINNASLTGDVVLTIETLDPSTLTSEQQKRVGDHPVYDFTLTKGDQQISNLNGGHVKISIPYTLKDGENPHQVVIYYLTNDGALKTVKGHYDANSKCVVFETTHFSSYAVGYNPVSFSDIASDAWYKDAVDFIAAREITTGVGNDLFAPENTLTRAQFIVMLMRAYGIEPDEDIVENFDDAGDTYYTGYLSAAKRLGISNGIGNNLYAPDQEITREQMFTLLYRTLEILGELPDDDTGNTLANYSDAGIISEYALDAMEALVACGIVNGSDGMLDPAGNSTRAQMAQVLYNLLSK